jgi:hypothetical protein
MAAAGAAAAAPTWTAPVQLGVGFGPSVAVDPAGDAVVGFSAFSLTQAFSRRRGAEKWRGPAKLAEGGSSPNVVVDDAGNALAVFTKGDWPNQHFQAAFRSGVDGGWQDAVTVSPAPQTTGGDVAVNAAGDAVVGFAGWSGRGYVVGAAVRPAASGRWQQVVDLSDPNGNSPNGAAVAIDPAGTAAALWVRAGPVADNPVVEASIRPPGGEWSTPAQLGGPYREVSGMRVAFDHAGNAIAGWIGLVGSTGDAVFAAQRPVGGSWSPPATLAPARGGFQVRELGLTVAATGEAVALWNEVTQGVQSATRPASGQWQRPVTLSASSAYVADAALASDRSGNAVAVWTEGLGDATVHAALRPVATGTWEPSVEIASGVFGSDAAVAIDENGDAVAAWQREIGPARYAIESSDLKAGGPVLAQLLVPAHGAAGVTTRFRVTPASWGSLLVGETAWDFGDGGSARGASVGHTYRRIGTYTVAVTQADAAGGTSRSTATIAVARATLTNRRAPVISGAPRPGATLRCSPGVWSGSQPIRFRYAWLRGSARIGSGPRYRVQRSDAGPFLSCRVTATNGPRTLAATSHPSASASARRPPAPPPCAPPRSG